MTMASGTYRAALRHRGLVPFLWTQFLGAFNDNVCKIIVALMLMRLMAAGGAANGSVAGSALAGAVFIIPFLIFAGYAGRLADIQSKSRVLVWMKCLEIGAMVLMLPALLLAQTGRVWGLLGVLFLMAVHSTFFGPAKYGIVPELLPDEELSRANGLLEMSTFVAIILGTSIGGELFQRFNDRPVVLTAVLVTIAVAGLATSLRVPVLPAAAPAQRMQANPWSEITRGIKRAYPDRTLWMTMVGLSYFWFLGALLQITLLPFGTDVLGVGEASATRLFTWLAIGIGAGSLAAGRLSGEKVELGLVPIGSLGIGVFSLAVIAGTASYATVAVMLVLLGFSAGLFAVPLNALVQQRPGSDEKGRIQAVNSVLNTVGILLAAGAAALLSGPAGLSVDRIIMAAGVFTLVATVYVLWLVPDFFVRFVLWCITHTIYRITIVGRPNIPARGPALLICNHVSMIDGVLVGACIQRFVRFIVYGPYFRQPLVHMLMKRMHAIAIDPGRRRAVVEAIEQARAELAAGHVVCIFAEGAVSRTGNLLPFQRGFERMVEGLDVPVIPIYLDRVWGSIFSFKRGRFFWKLPERLPYPVTVAFGAPLPATTTAADARMAIMELGSDAIRHRRREDQLHLAFMRSARTFWRRLAMADSTGQTLSYGRALAGTLALGRAIRARTGSERMVGVMLPASVGGALANLATLCAGKIPVNLNFTAGAEAMASAVDQCGIRTILTSKRFLAKASIAEMPGMVFLEDLRGQIGTAARLAALVEARLAPLWLLRRRYAARDAGALATVVFSSGSTGVPKGVMISHANVLANVDALAQVFPIGREDCFIGVLPFFHSFGFTGTLWFPLLQGASVAYHPNPMDAKTVGELAEKYRGTVIISTPTFCASYVRRCTKEQFAHLRYAVVGAEKLREPLANAFLEQFGVPLLEGYGCTEMAPVVAVNRPDVTDARIKQVGTKAGTVGHPLPGVSAKVVDRTTGAPLPLGEEGLLLVKGPNQMQGYLNQPERTAEVMRDGWYVTGDIARIDVDGFIAITDRMSRFSKIGGEMVPHLKIEETINAILGDSLSAVTAVPDESRGERLVAFYVCESVTPEALWESLSRTELPKLWLPRRDCLVPIDAVPTLGTGKVDLRRLRSLALEREAS
jgi:acyl-[acyl-carrier-protein]-phospholipid O-acyltransferase/long-chain-fatty-acid--[acyl-carrier-protein] ligase